MTQFEYRHVCRMKWQVSAYEWLCSNCTHGVCWHSITCRDDPDYEIYLFVHESDMVRFQLTWQ